MLNQKNSRVLRVLFSAGFAIFALIALIAVSYIFSTGLHDAALAEYIGVVAISLSIILVLLIVCGVFLFKKSHSEQTTDERCALEKQLEESLSSPAYLKAKEIVRLRDIYDLLLSQLAVLCFVLAFDYVMFFAKYSANTPYNDLFYTLLLTLPICALGIFALEWRPIISENRTRQAILVLRRGEAGTFTVQPIETEATSAKIRRRVKKTIVYSFLGIWAVIVLFPFYWMILSSVKSYGAYNAESTPQFITTSPTLDNYVTAFTSVPLLDYFINTLIFTLATTALMLVIIIPAAFAFARLNFKGKNLVFVLFLSLMMIPSELVVITNYVTITDLDLRNTFTGLILPSVTSVFYIYLLKENFAQIPDELYYAAKVDGTGDFKYMMKVMVPMCMPTVVTVTILKIIECWNSYVWPRLITTESDHFLLSQAIQEIRQNGFGRENVPAMMAAVVIVSVPLIILFIIFRDKIMAGVARGGTKG